MIGFIDEHKDRYGIEPICGVLLIVPIDVLRTTTRSATGLASALYQLA